MVFPNQNHKESPTMTTNSHNIKSKVLVAIDVAKSKNDVLVQLLNGSRKKFKVANTSEDYRMFIDYLTSLDSPCLVGFEATANYHRPIAFHLKQAGFEVCLISSLASARTREAMHNSWDKNDPKDTQVILHLLNTGLTQQYHDPILSDCYEAQELSKTYHQISLRKVKVQHSIMNHYLPLYFPEVQKYFHSSRAQWFTSLLLRFPIPNSITKYSFEEFVKEAWDVSGRKVNKKSWLEDFYQTAKESIGLPVPEASQAVNMFRIILQEHQDLCQMMKQVQEITVQFLENNVDYKILQTIPGIGPILALTILAEAGDLRRFNHYRQFLKYCGFDLCTHQSGSFRGTSKLSKRGNSRLRYVFWIAATIAVRMRENTFRKKYENYVKHDPTNPDVKRKAFTAVAAKVARVAYSLIKSKTNYRCYFESVIPSGKIPSVGP